MEIGRQASNSSSRQVHLAGAASGDGGSGKGPRTVLRPNHTGLAQILGTIGGAEATLWIMRPAVILRSCADYDTQLIRKAIEMAWESTDAADFKRRFHDKMLLGLADALELVPATFGILAVTRGEFRGAVVEGANFERDTDTIAAMAGSVAGALHGVEALPDQWVEAVRSANADQPGLVPKVYACDEEMSLVIMEHLRDHEIMGRPLVARKRFPLFVDQISTPGALW